MSTGSDSRTSTAATAVPAAARTRSVRASPATGVLVEPPRGTTTTATACVPTGPTPTTAAGVAAAAAFGRPQRVVPVLDVGRPNAHLTGHPGTVGQLAVGRTARRQRADPHVDPGQRPADADAVSRAGGGELRQRDVGDRQRLGHAVGGVQLGLRQQPLRRPQERQTHRSTG